MTNDKFMEFAGYRNMIIEQKIEECLSAGKRGKSEIIIDRDDLTDDEAEYLQREVMRRIKNS